MTSIPARAVGLDDFDFHARYLPGLQAILPIPITAITVGLNKVPIVATLLSLAVTVGLPRLLVQVVRERGTAAQNELWAKWGGSPTTQMMRLRGGTTAPADKERWHRVLGPAAKVQLPTDVKAESANSADADARYEQVVAYAREQTRDDELLLVENRSYNFDRNLYGMRRPARWLASIGVAITAMVVTFRARHNEDLLAPVIGLGANVVVLTMWIWLVTESRVRTMGDKYASRLLTVATHRQQASEATS